MDNKVTMNTKGNKHDRSRWAFTLIELLTVIAIMGIIAALVVTMGAAASQKKKILAVQADKNKLITMIESYHAKLNYYPPDNGKLAPNTVPSLYDGLAATNPLVYELYGATNTNSGANLIVFNSTLSAPTILSSDYNKIFARGGIANGDASEPQNFFQPGPSPKEYAPYVAGNKSTLPICGLIVPADFVPGKTNNFWHYDSSSPIRHNMGSFDLWAEFSIGSKAGNQTMITNGNW
jgi:prepilin-type N-terminal cleavage/methylation domain-containing protein